MVIVKMSEATYFHEPDEWYPASLAKVEPGEDYGYGPTVRLILHVDGDVDFESNEQRETWAMSSQKLSPRSKLYGWLKGIDPALIPGDGEVLDLSVLEGRRVDVMFEHKPKDDGTTKEVVSKIRSSKTPAPTAMPKPKTKEELEAPF